MRPAGFAQLSSIPSRTRDDEQGLLSLRWAKDPEPPKFAGTSGRITWPETRSLHDAPLVGSCSLVAWVHRDLACRDRIRHRFTNSYRHSGVIRKKASAGDTGALKSDDLAWGTSDRPRVGWSLSRPGELIQVNRVRPPPIEASGQCPSWVESRLREPSLISIGDRRRGRPQSVDGRAH